MKKKRVPIPTATAAQVLFMANRTCCVCRESGRPVQIHHIDENPANNGENNLAVLCLDCHRDTQIDGGFDRKLDADQVLLYRDDWIQLVAQARASETSGSPSEGKDVFRAERLTSIAEIYREKGEFTLLAAFYNSIGNSELRDKYIELALTQDPSDHATCYLRSMQGKAHLIPPEVVAREEARYDEHDNWSQRARLYFDLGRFDESAADYIRSINESLEEGGTFSAAFYLKELVAKGLVEKLFSKALDEAAEAKDLWWQVRAMEELGWKSELRELLLNSESEIEQSTNLLLLQRLAWAKGDERGALEKRKEVARATRTVTLSSTDISKAADEEE